MPFWSRVFLLLWAHGVRSTNAADNPAFMMVSGISASEEMCLTAASGGADADATEVLLEACAAALAAGDGRELWRRLPNGQIASAEVAKCLDAEGGAVVLKLCDGGSSWETMGNGQLRISAAGGSCLSQKGPAAGMEDVAAHGAITASSTADTAAHGANMAVDGSSSTFWASALDPTGPVTITADLGDQKKLRAVDISWEFPAKSFTVAVSTDGVKWSEVFATDTNVLSSVSIQLGSISASRVRVVMHEASASFHGRAVYGIRELVVRAPRLQTIVEDCAAAAGSADARDKYFANYVGEVGPCSSKALRSELPALEAARASVAAVVAELAEALPKMSSCHGTAGFISRTGGSRTVAHSGRSDAHATSGNAAAIVQKVDSQNGVDTSAVAALLAEARRVIVAARAALA